MPNALGTTTALSGNANSLANGAFTSMGVIDFTAAPPHECLLEFVFQASAATSGNRQVVIYLRQSVDGTNFSDAPVTTNTLNSQMLGSVYLPDTSSHRSYAFPVSPQYGGALPQKVEVYAYNDSGVALAASGNTGQYRTETFA